MKPPATTVTVSTHHNMPPSRDLQVVCKLEHQHGDLLLLLVGLQQDREVRQLGEEEQLLEGERLLLLLVEPQQVEGEVEYTVVVHPDPSLEKRLLEC